MTRFVDLAIELARNANVKGYHFGAVLAHKRDLISVGWCREKTHPEQAHWCTRAFKDTYKENNSYLHAEMDCLVKAPNGIDLCRSTLYIARLARSRLKSSMPCLACQLAIKAYDVGELVVYSEEDRQWKRLIR